MENTQIIPEEVIEKRIFIIRGQKIILDADLANLYGVSTKQFNQQVKRNIERFPFDFMFKLTPDEKEKVVTICDHLTSIKFSPHLPYAFTEHGVAMLSSVLNSDRAIEMNIFIIRAFIKMREFLATNKDLAHKIDEIERKQKEHGDTLSRVYSVVKQLIAEPVKSKGKLGFDTE